MLDSFARQPTWRRGPLAMRSVMSALLLSLAVLLTAPLAIAQTGQSSVATLRQEIDGFETKVRRLDAAFDRDPPASERPKLRASAEDAQKGAGASIAKLEAELTMIDARVQQIGPNPAAGEPADIKRQRATLVAQHAAIDASIRRGKLIVVEARQLVEEIDRSQTEAFNETVSSRVASPIGPSFWGAMIAEVPRDLAKIGRFLSQGNTELRARWRGTLPWPVLVGAVCALLILFPGRLAAKRLAQRYMVEDAPGHRVRRSGNAVQRVIVDTAAPLFAAMVLAAGLRAADLVPARWSALLSAFVEAAGYGGFTAAVTGALLMARQPSWRLASIDDATARALRPLTWVLAGLSALAIPITTFNASVHMGPAAQNATTAVHAALMLALLVVTLLTLARLREAAEDARRAASETPNGADLRADAHQGGLSIGSLLGWAVAAVALCALLLGYVNLAGFVVELTGWAIVLISALYLLAHAVDDVCSTAFARDGALGRAAARSTGLHASVIEQFGLLLSGALRLFLIILSLALLVTPFGSGGGLGSLFGRMGTLAQGIEFGGLTVSPGTILRGVVVLFVGLMLVRGFMRWLDGRFLPATELDGSSRNSISLVTRYVAIALVVIWALASLGIGVERIAILLSALSVGIGFGLQAITQNFISGLILLAERPIKIGDLVRVGNDEGDVRRISVRSTEIEMADHSTLIVPNSELITKSVLNKTRASPLGRVQIQFSIPIEIDVRRVRNMVLDAFTDEPAIIDEPAPAVFIDSIVDGRVMFNCIGHVASPRSAYGTRSSLFLALLARFHDEAIDIGTPAQRLELATLPPSA